VRSTSSAHTGDFAGRANASLTVGNGS
jgi:hypothetical protein